MKRYLVTIQHSNPHTVPKSPALAITILDQVFRQSIMYRVCPEKKTLKYWHNQKHTWEYLHQIDRLAGICFDFEYDVEDDKELVISLFYEIGMLHATDSGADFLHKYCEVTRR